MAVSLYGHFFMQSLWQNFVIYGYYLEIIKIKLYNEDKNMDDFCGNKSWAQDIFD